MATWLYKDGKEYLIEALEVGRHMDAGYTVDKVQKKVVKPKAPAKPVQKAAIPTLNNEA